jgi:ABC-type glycerol-3-phosphate transport system substrate-binding protein
VSNQQVSRRQLLKWSGALALAIPILQACGGGAATPATAPTTAPAAGTTPAAGAATTPAAGAATTPTTAPAAAATPAGGKVSLSIGTESGESLNWQRDFAKAWADKNPDVDLRIDTVTYGEAQQKTMTAIAAGTLQDISYGACKWFPLPAAKGGYRAIDDYVKTKDPGISDFFPGTIANSKFDGKLYGLPYDFDNGNYSVVVMNLDLFSSKGVTPPTDSTNVNEFVDLVAKVNDQANNIYGTDYLCGTYYDFSALSRIWGTDIISEDGKKFQFATDPKSTEAAKWATDIRAKYKAAPLKADLQSGPQGIGFPGGKLATSFQDINTVLGLGDAVGNKFKWDAVLFPKGLNGNRSFYEFSSAFCISSKSKAPEKAYDLVVYEASKEAGLAGLIKSHFAPNPRFSTWEDPAIGKLHPIFSRLLGWLKAPSGPTNFPLPGNLRYAELQDTWSNKTQGLFFGDVPFEQAMKDVQAGCQAILDKPRP